MLINNNRFQKLPILSLHMGRPIAYISELIVSPHDLKVVALRIQGPDLARDGNTFLETRDIRELSNLGIIVDSDDTFTRRGDVIKLDKILDLNFSLTGLKVETKKGIRVGRISEFVIETDSMRVAQIIVKRPAFKSLLDPELIISTKEIVEITDYKVIIKDERQKSRTHKKSHKDTFIPNFVNPFREPDFAEKSA